jgi:hypothetical protein
VTPREQKAEIILALRAEGAMWHEIGAIMGISASYARQIVRDPSGDKDAAKMKRWFAQALTREVPDDIHGKVSTYKNWGCRCQPCTKANTINHADYMRRIIDSVLK